MAENQDPHQEEVERLRAEERGIRVDWLKKNAEVRRLE
jgi:hypothetical protein